MALPNNPSVVRFVLQFKKDTRILQNVLHISKAPPWTVPNMASIADYLEAWFELHGKLGVSNQVQLEQISARLYDPANPLAYDLGINPPIVGTEASPPVPQNVTSTISWRTGLAGRRNRGRSYYIGLTENRVGDDDRIAGIQVASLANKAEQLLAGMPAGYNLCVWHLDLNTFTNVITYIIENIVDSQRRRLPGRGR